MTEKKNVERPLSFLISLWHGYIISGIFLLYGGVKIVLSFLDRDFSEMGQLIVFAVLGLLLLMIVLAYDDCKKFGWYGLIGMNVVIIVSALLNYQILESIIILLFSAVSLYLMYRSETKKYLLKVS